MTDLPYNIELEQQFLGAVLVNNENFHKVGSLVSPGHFYDPVHSRIWSHVSSRVRNDHIASPVTLKAEMEGDDGLKELGGPSYLARLAGASIGSFAVLDYAKELVELSERRRITKDAQAIIEGLQQGGSSADATSAMELSAMAAQEQSVAPRSMSLLAAHTKSLATIHEAQKTGYHGILWGLRDLDEMITLKPKRSTILAGATSMGKTSLATWLAYTAAKQGFGVGFASLEMGEEDLANRINSIDSRIPYQVMDRPMSEAVFRNVMEAAKEQESLPIEIYSDRVKDIAAILSETRRIKVRWKPNGHFKGLGLLIIDYIQLIRGRGTSFEVLAQASQSCKSIAKALDIPVVALAQVSRDMSKRDSKIPHLGDLRGGGDLENDADNVIFCHRPAYYLERELRDPPKDDAERCDLEAALTACRDTMDIIVSKQRMGSIGQVRVGCDLGTNRFWNLDQQEEIAF